MYTVAAPISTEIYTFFKIALGVDIIDVYGMTELSGGAIMSRWGDRDLEYRGGITPVSKIRLKDLPELNYSSSDKPYPRGEIQFQGITSFGGYYKNKEKTLKTIEYDTEEDEKNGTRNFWISTGDVGMILPNGAVKIIDRTKNILKLS
jgi:long-chain acyl-CoA synthetase